MQIKILCPVWGHEHIKTELFLDNVRCAGYDGVETWIPADVVARKQLLDYLQKHEMHIVAHQHEADGKNFTEFKTSFLKQIQLCANAGPILINSHTGKDYFSFEQNLELIDIAQEFSEKSGIMIVHETHRGRLGYSPQMIEEYFEKRKDFLITADFSHWVCVTESMLQNFSSIVDEAIIRSRHIHARVGFEQGPQVSDPRAPEWNNAVNVFLSWWDRIIQCNAALNCKLMPLTTEFGPVPYMPTIPFTHKPVADQFEINCYMKDVLKDKYALYA